MPEINYRITTDELSTTQTTRYAPCNGIINSAILHFPAGCNSLVEIFINKRTKQILPSPITGGTGANIGIALDDTTQSFNINIPVNRGDPLEVVVNNHDEDNEHTNTIVLLIETTLEYKGP